MCSENVPEILEHKGKLRTPVFFYVQCVRKCLIIKKKKNRVGGEFLLKENTNYSYFHLGVSSTTWDTRHG